MSEDNAVLLPAAEKPRGHAMAGEELKKLG